MVTMSDVEETLSVAEAARRLRLTTEETYRLVFSKRLPTVEAASGRRLVPVSAIERWQQEHPVSTQ
jgi:excisionase family DNA binding protein